ncbi:MAG: tetratricopeptide repeat protein [Chloroflexi bacterium]|nr:tetratricopeptide repeat protein [Chloroflexota bacterium]
MLDRPTGTVTFLFTDIEGSTRLAQQHPAAWPAAQARHHAILQNAIESHGGYVFQVIGDAFCAAFHTALDALAAALDAQHALNAELWGDAIVRVRMGLHTGAATARADGDYEGYLTLVRVQRIMSGAYGGQVLMSQDVADLVGRDLPAGVSLLDLGTHRLKDLTAPEHLFQVVAQGLPTNFPPLKTADHPNNLPTQLTSFIGRDAEVAEVRRLLGGTRLLTLMGAGGVGKTRLALQVAAEELAAFPDGVWFAELAPLADPTLIASTIASAVGVREEPNRPILGQLGDYFRGKTALVVLDNCEHLIADAAQVCDTLLHAAPHLKIIATSREALGIAGETAYRVPSLGIPTDSMTLDALSHVASVQLFTERARAARGDFSLSTANATAVAQICRRLDGIPLAIELAAARIRTLSPEQIVTRLDDRFRLLTGGSRTALPRQQTLRAAIDWSYSLLTESERILLRRLSVFAGGWTLEAAEPVCSGDGLAIEDILDLLTHLVEKSLIAAETAGDMNRYQLLETVRQYAREKLMDSGEVARLRNQHLLYFFSMAQEAEKYLRSATQARWLQRLDLDVDNVRTALDWGTESDLIEKTLRLAAALHRYWFTRGKSEILERLSVLIASADERNRLQRTAPERVAALLCLGNLLWNLQGRFADARPRFEELVHIAMETGDARLECEARRNLGLVISNLGYYDDAREQLEKALQIARALNSPDLMAWSGTFLGHQYRVQNDMDRAERIYAESLVQSETTGDLVNQGQLHSRLGFLELHRGAIAQADMRFRKHMKIVVELGLTWSVAAGFANFSALATAEQQYKRAARLAGACAKLSELTHVSLQRLDRLEHEQVLARLHSAMAPSEYDAEWTVGQAMSYDEALAYALEVPHD